MLTACKPAGLPSMASHSPGGTSSMRAAKAAGWQLCGPSMLAKARLLLAGAVVALAAALGAGVYYQHTQLKKARHEAAMAVTRAEELETALAAEKRARVAQLAARRKAEAQLKESRSALDQTLKANPDWAAQPVPPDVADWVRQHGQDPAPAPTR